jgi:dihydrofolate synthase/folylpolyglutamate synthase
VACAITSIGYDHQQYLGNSLRDIAAEKAGIVKPGVPVVVGAVPTEAAEAIRQRAGAVSAPLVWATEGVTASPSRELPDRHQQFSLHTPARDYGIVNCALAGEHQVQNAIVAVRLLEEANRVGIPVSREAIVAGLADVRWPGRLEWIRLDDGRQLLLDAAHNEAGAAALARYLAAHPPAMPLVFAVMRDKKIESMLRALLPHVSSMVVTRASNPRSADPSTVAALIRRVSPRTPAHVEGSARDALQRAWSAGQSVAVAGSIFLLADVMKELGRS